MKRFFLLILLAFFSVLFLFSKTSFAIEDPLSLPNNKMGVHILFPEELNEAAVLVNSNGGDWGYVTIPIQSGDRNMEKWQKFMNSAKQNRVIPIIRLATEGDYFNTTVWRKPSEEDVLDFANFLNSLIWPVKNRYVVVFNEVNRSDEWEGRLNPKEYANVLNYAVSVFKSLNEDFFIISSGLDNAAPNAAEKYMNEYDYMTAMSNAVPGVFGLIDGLGSHSYPNPGFRQMPYILTSQSIYSFNFEKNLAYRLSGKNLPVFITETGWSKEAVSENQIASYFKYAFQYVWRDKSIVAVTPFLLQAGSKPFSQFSLTEGDGRYNEIFLALQEIPKIKGKPTVDYGVSLSSDIAPKKLPIKVFPKKIQYKTLPIEKVNIISDFFKWLMKLS
ncbi:MAG: hypothetical protein Q8P29_01430, partial [Candidatus Levybacteria bacterium]|nr:hypothetical protein [Candidatus Levybacteria bacterium]